MNIVELNAEARPGQRRDVRDFLHLPFTLYRDVPQWVPPLLPGERARFRPDYAFYRHSEAAFFLVRDEGGRAVGRLAVLEHRPHNAFRGKRDALLYLYEAVDDERVARALFEAAEGWARARGLTRLVGPKGFMTGDGLGLLVEGFAHRPALGIPYNPPCYVRQWEEVGGMVKEIDYLSAYAAVEGFVYPERIGRIAGRIRERRGFSVPTFTSKAELRAYVEPLKDAYNSAFVKLWSYTPIPEGELDAIIARLFTIADPRLMKVILKDGEVAGFQFAYPDLSVAFQRIKGHLWPFGWLALLRERRRTDWLNVNGNAILPKYQGGGANAVLYDEMLHILMGHPQFKHVDIVQVQETNTRMLADLKALLPLDVYKRHRVYSKVLG
jgi:GNAT superfamily N-acetyltransferase